LALKEDQQQKEKEKEKENKRHTMSHPPDHIPELDSPHQSRSPIKKDKKERVSVDLFFQTISLAVAQVVSEVRSVLQAFHLFSIIILPC
jgi:hypothetical protein